MQSYRKLKKISFLIIFTLSAIVFNGTLSTAQIPTQPAPQAAPSNPQPAKSLYDRLGGVNSIAAVVDDFIDRLLADPVITSNKDVANAIGKTTKAGLKYKVTEFICEKTGGLQKYTGRTIKDSHQGLNISEGEWGATVKDFLDSLTKFNVPEKEQTELLMLVGSTKSDIVTAKPLEEAVLETVPQPVQEVLKPAAPVVPPAKQIEQALPSLETLPVQKEELKVPPEIRPLAPTTPEGQPAGNAQLLPP